MNVCNIFKNDSMQRRSYAADRNVRLENVASFVMGSRLIPTDPIDKTLGSEIL
jgi:hypothetical protein